MSEHEKDECKTNIEFSIDNKRYCIEWDGLQFTVTTNTTLKSTVRSERRYYTWVNSMLKSLANEIVGNRKATTLKELQDIISDSMSAMDDIMRMIDIRYPSITLKIGDGHAD